MSDTPQQVNQHSVDFMVATMMTEQRLFKEAVLKELAEIKAQTTKTNGRVNELERNELIRRVKFGVAATFFSTIGGGVAWAAQILFSKQ